MRDVSKVSLYVRKYEHVFVSIVETKTTTHTCVHVCVGLVFLVLRMFFFYRFI